MEGESYFSSFLFISMLGFGRLVTLDTCKWLMHCNKALFIIFFFKDLLSHGVSSKTSVPSNYEFSMFEL